MLLAFHQQQSGEPVINGNGAAATACLGFLEPAAVRLGLFEAPRDRQGRAGWIKVRPSQGEDFVSTGAGEGRNGNDRINRQVPEADQKRRKLVLIENLTRLALTGNRRVCLGRRADDKQSLP